jgi:hypothetical protein
MSVGGIKDLASAAFKVQASTFNIYQSVPPRQTPQFDDVFKDDLENSKTKISAKLIPIIRHNWPFSWIRGRDVMIDLISKELSRDLAEEITCMAFEGQNEEWPHIKVAFGGKVRLNNANKKTKITLAFKIGLVTVKTMDEAIPYEDKENDVLIVEVFKDMGLVGLCHLPLKEVYEGQSQGWKITKADKSSVVGSIDLRVTFFNKGTPTVKAQVQKTIVGHMMGLLGRVMTIEEQGQFEDLRPLQYGVLVKETKSASADDCQTTTVISLKSRMDDLEVASHVSSHEVFIPIQDLASQKLEFKVDKRKGSSARRKLDFGIVVGGGGGKSQTSAGIPKKKSSSEIYGFIQTAFSTAEKLK